MRGTVLEYERESDSYRIRGDLDGALRDVHAENVAPIPASAPGIQSDTPDFGMFSAPAPLNLSGHRGHDGAAAILLPDALPHLRGAQGCRQSPAQLVSETPPAMASRPKSSARRTGDTEVVEVSDDSGDDGDGENGDLRRGDVFDEDGDDSSTRTSSAPTRRVRATRNRTVTPPLSTSLETLMRVSATATV